MEERRISPFTRTEMVLGERGMERLRRARVAIFGLGGVGGHAMEALARCGVGALDLIDNDRISLSNLNRQLLATLDTVGQNKVDAAAERVRSINPDCIVRTYRVFYLPETRHLFRFADYDYVIDAVDTVTAKLDIAEAAIAAGTPIISAMGTGNKVDPSALRLGDIYETSICPLARIMRKQCRKRGITKLRVLYSTEEPRRPLTPAEPSETAPDDDTMPDRKPARPRDVPGSVSFVPSVAGLIMAGEVVRTLVQTDEV